MSTQMLFYENVSPVNSKRHRDRYVQSTRKRYGFSRSVNSVPLTAVEIPLAAREYSIVFSGEDETLVPVAILGIEGNENQYVKEDGSWDAHYIPAFIRRYPFVFARSEDGGTFTLCIDETFEGYNDAGRGERLFDADGNHGVYLDNVLEFLKEYQLQFARTQTFCRRLGELELLEATQAQVRIGDEQRALTGFMAVSRERLKALAAEKLHELTRNDELELIYAHLHSLSNFQNMIQRSLAKRGADRPPSPSATAANGNASTD